jgi:translocon-associated protein subunit beta
LVYFFLQTSHIVCSGGVLSHTFELEAKSKGVFSGEPAVIKFRVPTNAALQVYFVGTVVFVCFLF